MPKEAMADEELPVIAHFEVRRRSYLAPDGTMLRPLPGFASEGSQPELCSWLHAIVHSKAATATPSRPTVGTVAACCSRLSSARRSSGGRLSMNVIPNRTT